MKTVGDRTVVGDTVTCGPGGHWTGQISPCLPSISNFAPFSRVHFCVIFAILTAKMSTAGSIRAFRPTAGRIASLPDTGTLATRDSSWTRLILYDPATRPAAKRPYHAANVPENLIVIYIFLIIITIVSVSKGVYCDQYPSSMIDGQEYRWDLVDDHTLLGSVTEFRLPGRFKPAGEIQ